MSDIEAKAREYGQDCIGRTEFSEDRKLWSEELAAAYLAGYTEALRWRDPVKEPPSTNAVVHVICKNGPYFPVFPNHYSNGEWEPVFRKDFTELKIVGWREIGPLPTEPKP